MKNQRTVLKERRGLNNEVILSADKGNVTVVMRRCDYHGKVKEILGTGIYALGGTAHFSLCLCI